MPERLHGVLAPLVTPFSDDGETLDETRLRALVDRLIDDGADGLVPNGSTGEFTRLSDAERRQVTEIVCSQADRRTPVVPQTGALTTKQAIELTRHAEASGAAAVMVVPPFYSPLTDDGYRAYYSAIAETTDLPMIAYNIPGATGKHFTAEWLVALAQEIPNVQYVKESSGDMVLIGALACCHGDDITVLNGFDTLHLPALVLGAAGSIMGCANVVMREQMAVTAAFRDGRQRDAVESFHKIYPLLEFFRRNPPYPAAVKCALEIMGHGAGPVRAPGQPLGPAGRSRAMQVLERLGLAAATTTA